MLCGFVSKYLLIKIKKSDVITLSPLTPKRSFFWLSLNIIETAWLTSPGPRLVLKMTDGEEMYIFEKKSDKFQVINKPKTKYFFLSFYHFLLCRERIRKWFHLSIKYIPVFHTKHTSQILSPLTSHKIELCLLLTVTQKSKMAYVLMNECLFLLFTWFPAV